MAVAGEQLILEREEQKRAKYEPLAGSMERRKASKDHREIVTPFVIGDLSTVAHFAKELTKLNILSEADRKTIIINCQLDMLYFATRLLKSYLAMR